ncbi:MAG: hypothetical protein EA352_11000 [Gemmatimonadales bacterium]|nr:MAG: hypothetical protein EA352_11000 [Gemmatimonadales bacterium]
MHSIPRLRPALVAGLAALALTLTGCADETSAPFDFSGEGELDGLVYFDSQRTGIFDPSDGDDPLSNVALEIRERGTTRAFQGSQVLTDSEGRFEVTGLPPGTHHLWVDSATLPEGVLLCQNPLSVSVYRFETAGVLVGGEPVCLISVQEAKELSTGEFVNIRGVVTSAPSELRSNADYTYIQDGSAGVRVFGSLGSAGAELQRGDRVTLTGTTGSFNNDAQITSPTIEEVEPDFGELAPEPTTTQALAEAGPDMRAPLQGRLVVVRGAELTRGFTTGGNRNGLVDDGSGPVEVRVETGLSGSGDETIRQTLGLEIGACYDITGVVGNFNGTAQLFPRAADDFVEVDCTG